MLVVNTARAEATITFVCLVSLVCANRTQVPTINSVHALLQRPCAEPCALIQWMLATYTIHLARQTLAAHVGDKAGAWHTRSLTRLSVLWWLLRMFNLLTGLTSSTASAATSSASATATWRFIHLALVGIECWWRRWPLGIFPSIVLRLGLDPITIIFVVGACSDGIGC